MKSLACSLFLIPALWAGQTPEPAQNPVITFARTHVDFGKISADHKVSCRYAVSNTGKAYLNITRVEPSCGCTYTMLGKWSLAPGESTELEASFNPAGMRGLTRKSLTITSNDPVHPKVTLTFEADVVQEIMADPSTLFFQDVLRSGTAKKVLRLKSGSGQPVRVKEIKAPGAPYLSVVSRTEGNDAVLDVSLDGHKIPMNKWTGADSLTIITASERTPVLNVYVQWDVKPVITASPERVGWVEAAGKELRAALVLKQAEGKPFRILSAKPSHASLRVEGLGRPAAAQQELQILLAPNVSAGTYNERVVFSLDDPNQSELVVRVTAILR